MSEAKSKANLNARPNARPNAIPAGANASARTVSARADAPRRASPKRTNEIIDAAANVFSRLGYHGASTQDIADRLGMRQASLYYYFASKDAALEHVCAKGVEGFLEQAKAIAARPDACREQLREIILQHMLPMLDRPDYVRVFMTQRRFLSVAARRRIASLSGRYERVLEGVIAQGIAAGEFRDDLAPRDVMLTLVGACNAANHWQGFVEGMTVQRAAATVSALVLDGLAKCEHGGASRRGVASNRRPR